MEQVILNTRPKIEIPAEEIKRFCAKWKIAEVFIIGSVLLEDFRPSAVERNMEIIGKAARPVSESFLHWSGVAGAGPQRGGK